VAEVAEAEMDETSEPEITREEGPSKGRYAATLDGHAAELTYSRLGDATIILDHTGVPDALRGRNVGRALVARAVADARAEGRRIVPLCPFAKALIARTPDWHDVLA
jgi:predicted GNAT family acetyltransferase